MRISDWSSDVCSSDLLRRAVAVDQDQGALAAEAAQVGERTGLGRAARLRAELADRVEVGGAQVVGDGHFAAGVDLGAVDDRDRHGAFDLGTLQRSEEHTSELQPLMRISYAVFCLKKKTNQRQHI